MSEHSPTSAEKAAFTSELQATKVLLSEDNQNLADIHPQVSKFVDTDTLSEDFGRIKHVAMAEALGHYQDEVREDELDKAGIGMWIDERTNSRMAVEMSDQAKGSGASEDEANKAAQDFLITQGDATAQNTRVEAIYDDVETQKGGPSFIAAVRAARAVGKVIKASRKERRG